MVEGGGGTVAAAAAAAAARGGAKQRAAAGDAALEMISVGQVRAGGGASATSYHRPITATCGQLLHGLACWIEGAWDTAVWAVSEPNTVGLVASARQETHLLCASQLRPLTTRDRSAIQNLNALVWVGLCAPVTSQFACARAFGVRRRPRSRCAAAALRRAAPVCPSGLDGAPSSFDAAHSLAAPLVQKQVGFFMAYLWALALYLYALMLHKR